MPDHEKEEYLLNHPYERISRDFRLIHKSVTKLITRRRYFNIEVNEMSLEFNTKSIPFNSGDVKFCSKVLKLCLDKLLAFINEYQIKELPDEEIIRQQIEYLNKVQSIKLPASELIRFYLQLLKIIFSHALIFRKSKNSNAVSCFGFV